MKIQNIVIRETTTSDFNDIMEVERLAFGQEKEATLTANLLKDSTAKPYLSLLAFLNEEAVGHILFTRTYINEIDLTQPLQHMLAPLAVKPNYQGQGIGTQLINEGLQRLKVMGSNMVCLLGHPSYYPKFGFINDALKLGYHTTHPIPEEFANAWMVLSLTGDEFTIPKGKVVCSEELNRIENWQE